MSHRPDLALGDWRLHTRSFGRGTTESTMLRAFWYFTSPELSSSCWKSMRALPVSTYRRKDFMRFACTGPAHSLHSLGTPPLVFHTVYPLT